MLERGSAQGAPGDRVRSGERLAAVGNTGNISETSNRTARNRPQKQLFLVEVVKAAGLQGNVLPVGALEEDGVLRVVRLHDVTDD